MKNYIKVLYDDLKKEVTDNTIKIFLLEQQNEIYDKIKEKIEKSLEQADDVINKIKEFINELEHNKQVDKDDNLDISGVSCDYVIERLKDIIK